MAYIRKTAKGWRAEVERKGVRKSQTFTTKAAASAWAAREEAAIIDGTAERWPRKTLADAIRRYELEVTPSKGAAKFERVAFGVTLREHPELCAMVLHKITTADLATWRDAMLRRVSGSTVIRYGALLRNVWTVAAREWGWCPEPSPWRALRFPQHNPPRTAMVGWRQIRTILRRLNYVTGVKPASKGQEVAYAWLIALRTGMRAGEVRIAPENFDPVARVVTLDKHKTSRTVGRRKVPVSKQAARLLSLVGRFTISGPSLDAIFRKARAQTLAAGFTFNDSRATALTHLSKRVDVLALARISGHKDLRELIRTYYRESEADIALRL